MACSTSRAVTPTASTWARPRGGTRCPRIKSTTSSSPKLDWANGRGGEELQALNAAGIRAEVVPGITAATACAAATGIPLTHRDHASAVTFVTGHLAREKGGDGGAPDVDWAALARSGATLAVYMGIGGAGVIANDLSRHGLADTPVAVIENGTRPDQRVFTGQVHDLDALVRANGITGPALIVIGDVAALTDVSTVTGGLAPLAAAM